MDGQLNNSTGGGFNPDNASINQTRGDLTSETNPPFHANSGHSSLVHPGRNFSSEMPYLGQPYSGSYPFLTPFGPSPSYPCVYLGPVSDPYYTSHFSYFTGDSFYIPGAHGYPQFASHIPISFSWSTPEVFDTIYVPASNIPGPPPFIVTDADAGLYLYGAGNISGGIGQQTSGFVGQSSHDANVNNNNNTVPASYDGNAQNLGYGHVAASSGGSARLPPSRFSGSTWQHDYLSGRARPTGNRPRSRSTATNRRNARDEEQRQLITGGASNFLPNDLSDFYGNIRPNYEPRIAALPAQAGLPEEIIANSLAEFMFVASGQDEEEKTCPICLENKKNMARMARVKTCGHEFHVRCIKEWLRIKGICPVCRTKAWNN